MMNITLGFGDNFYGFLMLEKEGTNSMKVAHLLTVMAQGFYLWKKVAPWFSECSPTWIKKGTMTPQLG